MQQGKKIDMLKAEPPLTPAVLLGYDDSLRIQSKVKLFKYLEFNEVISELTERLEEHKEKARKLIEASKQVTRTD